jgi:hypothetical protein
MRIEDGYLYCDRDEAENIVRFQQADDEYRVVTPHNNEAPPWHRVANEYHPVDGNTAYCILWTLVTIGLAIAVVLGFN